MKNFIADFDVVFHVGSWKCARMLGFLEKSIKLESNVLFSVVDFKMRKDGSKLRNRGLKIDFVEHDVGFSVVLSKMRKDASTLRNRGLKIENVELVKGFPMVVSKIRKDVSL